MTGESKSVPTTKATRGLGYQRKIRDSVGYLMRNEISLSLPSHQGTLANFPLIQYYVVTLLCQPV